MSKGIKDKKIELDWKDFSGRKNIEINKKGELRKKNIQFNSFKYETPRIYFSESSAKTLNDWTGGDGYKDLGAIELFGFRIVFWRKL